MVAAPQVSVVQRWSSETALPAVSAAVSTGLWWAIAWVRSVAVTRCMCVHLACPLPHTPFPVSLAFAVGLHGNINQTVVWQVYGALVGKEESEKIFLLFK